MHAAGPADCNIAMQDAMDAEEAESGLQAEVVSSGLPDGGDATILREGLAIAAGGWPLPR